MSNGNGAPAQPAEIEVVHLRVDEDALTVDDLCALENGDLKTATQLRAFLSRFVVGADGVLLGEAEGRAIIGGLSVAQMKATLAQFGAQVKTALALNPTNAAT